MADKKRPVIFLAVGLFNALFDFCCYTVITSFLLTEKSQIGLAGVMSGTAALICAYLTHSLMTWRGSNIGYQTIIRFILFTGFGMWVLRPIMLSLFIHLNTLYSSVHDLSGKLHLPFSQEFIANTGAFGFMIILLLIYNYLVYDRFVFKRQIASDATSSSDD